MLWWDAYLGHDSDGDIVIETGPQSRCGAEIFGCPPALLGGGGLRCWPDDWDRGVREDGKTSNGLWERVMPLRLCAIVEIEVAPSNGKLPSSAKDTPPHFLIALSSICPEEYCPPKKGSIGLPHRTSVRQKNPQRDMVPVPS